MSAWYAPQLSFSRLMPFEIDVENLPLWVPFRGLSIYSTLQLKLWRAWRLMKGLKKRSRRVSWTCRDDVRNFSRRQRAFQKLFKIWLLPSTQKARFLQQLRESLEIFPAMYLELACKKKLGLLWRRCRHALSFQFEILCFRPCKSFKRALCMPFEPFTLSQPKLRSFCIATYWLCRNKVKILSDDN